MHKINEKTTAGKYTVTDNTTQQHNVYCNDDAAPRVQMYNDFSSVNFVKVIIPGWCVCSSLMLNSG